MASLFSAISIGLIIMIMALLLTFLTMILLIFVIKILASDSSSLMPIDDKCSAPISKEIKQNGEELNVIIATAVGAYLEQESEQTNLQSENIALKINPSSLWEMIGRQNHFTRRYKR